MRPVSRASRVTANRWTKFGRCWTRTIATLLAVVRTAPANSTAWIGDVGFVEYHQPVVSAPLEGKTSGAGITLDTDSRFYSRMGAARTPDAKYIHNTRIPDEGLPARRGPGRDRERCIVGRRDGAIAAVRDALFAFVDAIDADWPDEADGSDGEVLDDMDDEARGPPEGPWLHRLSRVRPGRGPAGLRRPEDPTPDRWRIRRRGPRPLPARRFRRDGRRRRRTRPRRVALGRRGLLLDARRPRRLGKILADRPARLRRHGPLPAPAGDLLRRDVRQLRHADGPGRRRAVHRLRPLGTPGELRGGQPSRASSPPTCSTCSPSSPSPAWALGPSSGRHRSRSRSNRSPAGWSSSLSGLPVVGAVAWRFRRQFGYGVLRVVRPITRRTPRAQRGRPPRTDARPERRLPAHHPGPPRARLRALFAYVGWLFFALPLYFAGPRRRRPHRPPARAVHRPREHAGRTGALAGGGSGAVVPVLAVLLVALTGVSGEANATAVAIIYRVASYLFAILVGGLAAVYVLKRN